MDKKYQVFVSSTYEDLKSERSAAYSCLLDNNCIPVGMEQFPASPLSQWEYITKMIDISDYYLLIIAGRYGSIDTAVNMSYTEKEFHYAKDKGIPILAFLHQHPENIPLSKSEQNNFGREKLNAFRQTVQNSGIHVNYYNDENELKYKIGTSINKTIVDFPAIGWIRGDSLTNNCNIENQIANYLQNHTISSDEIDALFNDTLTISKHSHIISTPQAISEHYQCTELSGQFSFDYANNNGEFVIGSGEKTFVTKWSKASNTSIHAYNDGAGIVEIGRIKAPIELKDAIKSPCDFSSRTRTPNIGDIIIWKNHFGNYAGTKILHIKDDTRGDDHDELSCEYIIYD